MKLALAGGVALLALAGGTNALRSGNGAAAPKPVAAAPARAEAKVPVTVAAPTAIEATAGPKMVEPPRSLRGTEVDGDVRVGPDGALIVGPELRALFDYFLSATGEESAAALRARIVAEIRARASGAAAEQAIGLLDKYLAYREAARDLKGDGDAAARLAAIHDLRKRYFGDDAEALFGDEEREGAVAAARAAIARDTTLTPEEREAKMAALSDQLPEQAREAHARAVAPLVQQGEERALRAGGATDEDIYEYRAATVGEEAADRLAELDRQRAAWKARVEAFKQERAKLGGRRAAEEALLEASFTPEERLRVRAILGMSEP